MEEITKVRVLVAIGMNKAGSKTLQGVQNSVWNFQTTFFQCQIAFGDENIRL